MADQILRNPHVVDVAHRTRLATIEHALYPVEGTRKVAWLERILTEETLSSAIVFTRTKHRARRLAQQLERSGHCAVALQGNMSQGQRERAMDGFRKRQFDVLVATDIAARAIDVEQVSHFVNLDMPNTPDAYTHRIGRTGRADREGKAYTFVTAEDHSLVTQVKRRLEMSIPRRDVHGIESIPFPSSGGRGRARFPGSRGHQRQRRDLQREFEVTGGELEETVCAACENTGASKGPWESRPGFSRETGAAVFAERWSEALRRVGDPDPGPTDRHHLRCLEVLSMRLQYLLHQGHALAYS